MSGPGAGESTTVADSASQPKAAAAAASTANANSPENQALMAQSWVQKLKRFNEGKAHKTAAENDREADVEFLKLLEEEKNIEEKRNPSFKTIPRFFFKKPTNESSLYFKVRQEARTRFL